MKRVLTVVVICLFICACDRQESVANSDDSQVLVSLGARQVTAQTVSNSVMIVSRIREISTKKALAPKQFPYWANSTAMKMIPSLVAAERLDMKLQAQGVISTTESDAAVLGRYNRVLKKNFSSVSELAEVFGPQAAAFRVQFARESRQEAFYRADKRFAVSEKDIKWHNQSYSNAVASAIKYNEAAFARATNACERLKAGAPWIEVAKEVTDEGKSEDDAAAAKYYEFWEDVQLKNSPIPDVAAAVAQLKPGEWTAPIECDEGIVIARLNGRDAKTGAFKCARILINLALPPREIPEKDLQAYLLAKKRRQYQFSIRQDLVDDYPAEYPLGTNFIYKIWAEPKKLKKGFNTL